ncbi:MAG: pilus assembly protein [Phycisphaerae bacterium]|nr:pilus assembly protein [Phycisphaerae bacterium]
MRSVGTGRVDKSRALCGVAVATGAAVVAAGLIAALGGSAAAWGGPGRSYLTEALLSALSVKCFALAIGCALGLGVIGAMLLRPVAALRRRRGSQEGVAMLEFALVLPIALMLVLVMAQSSLLLGANVCVHYAAYCAARTAIVTVPAEFLTEPPNETSGEGGPKWERIRQSAVWALMPIACGSSYYPSSADAGILTDGLDEFFAAYGRTTPAWATNTRVLSGKLSYASDSQYTTVTLGPPTNGAVYDQHENLRVDVRHTYYMPVPFASSLFAKILDRANGVAYAGSLDGEYGLDIHAGSTLTNQGVREYIEQISFQ